MSTVARGNAAFAGIGAGLVHLSLAAGQLDAGTLPLAALGVAELVWGVVVLARGRIVLPRTALAVTGVTVAGFVLAIAAGLLRDPLPALAAGALQLVAAAVVAATLRSQRTVERPVSAPRAVLGLFAGALLVSALATPALSASSEGSHDMGGMMTTVTDSGHSH
ncbi:MULTISPECIES: hypothetical protein [unclassified Rathayibacter]|uniref:hypothetical protein n=1 Tax=unclassified Rathayibacter TaxID=2609250 RepID=UPI0010476390|nr:MULTISPECIES: hypothetical protein [unclassified Rathayibacter]TCL85515.1 hypothetical protein EDF49_101183 [Rathayibacter sp. PhB192]TCM31336.1 hypothetical protein EDF43_101183 [Rathayibacter sp. PhB179]